MHDEVQDTAIRHDTEPYPTVKKLATARAMTPQAVRTGVADTETSCSASSRFTSPTSMRAS